MVIIFFSSVAILKYSVLIILKFFGFFFFFTKWDKPKFHVMLAFFTNLKFCACIDIISIFSLPLLKIRVGTYVKNDILKQNGLLLNYF